MRGAGAIALALLILAEVGVSVFVFGNSLGDYAATYRTRAGTVGLIAQIIYALFPVLQTKRWWEK